MSEGKNLAQMCNIGGVVGVRKKKKKPRMKSWDTILICFKIGAVNL